MSSPQTRYQGVTLTDRFLTVHFRMEVGTTHRFVSVKIPVIDLARVGVVPAIDRAVRETLAEVWAQGSLLDEDVRAPWEVRDN